jgi:hypothetical protein
MKRRSEDMRKRCIERNKRNICENKSVHIGDVPSSELLERGFKASHTE